MHLLSLADSRRPGALGGVLRVLLLVRRKMIPYSTSLGGSRQASSAGLNEIVRAATATATVGLHLGTLSFALPDASRV